MSIVEASHTRNASWLVPALLLGGAVILCLSVLIINKGPLYYYDTGSYIRQGAVALDMIFPGDPNDMTGAAHYVDDDSTASGSRSLLYGVLIAAFFEAGTVFALPVLQLMLLLTTIWLVVSVARRDMDMPRGRVVMITVPLLVASTTSLPFYIAYLMPDIFAAILLLVTAMLVAFGHKMSSWELLLATGLAAMAALLHPSHMAISGLMIPFVLLVAMVRKTPGRWRVTALLSLVVVIAIAERKVFEFTVETVADKEVVYTPHITARLIEDGPGLDYLDEICPDQTVTTCALHEALSWSDDPYRLTASHIIFERDPRLGSFRLMQADDQQRVALAQTGFFVDVFLSRPVATTFAFVENTYQQILRYSINMTIPTDETLGSARYLARLEQDQYHLIQGGSLMTDLSWIKPVDMIHGAIYATSFGAIILLLLWPGQLSGEIRLFAVFILLGLALNALVCGGVSQPADRYGARVMWLLPFTAAFLVPCLRQRRRQPDTGART